MLTISMLAWKQLHLKSNAHAIGVDDFRILDSAAVEWATELPPFFDRRVRSIDRGKPSRNERLAEDEYDLVYVLLAFLMS